jgi:hypothetical protein
MGGFLEIDALTCACRTLIFIGSGATATNGEVLDGGTAIVTDDFLELNTQESMVIA